MRNFTLSVKCSDNKYRLFKCECYGSHSFITSSSKLIRALQSAIDDNKRRSALLGQSLQSKLDDERYIELISYFGVRCKHTLSL